MKKKRGRKSNISMDNKSNKEKIKKLSSDNYKLINEDIIIHLRIKPDTVESNLEYSPHVNIPTGNEYNNLDNCEWLNKNNNNNSLIGKQEVFRNNELQNQNNISEQSLLFSCESGNHKKKSDIYCYWCCHSFQTKEYHLPLYTKKKEYFVFGHFCSAECAASYNFNDLLEYGNSFTRYSLLHSLYYDVFKGDKINLAPSRMSLNIFGGHLTIDEFRKFTTQSDFNYLITISPIKTIPIHHSYKSSKLSIQSKTFNLKRKNPIKMASNITNLTTSL